MSNAANISWRSEFELTRGVCSKRVTVQRRDEESSAPFPTEADVAAWASEVIGYPVEVFFYDTLGPLHFYSTQEIYN